MLCNQVGQRSEKLKAGNAATKKVGNWHNKTGEGTLFELYPVEETI
jgi:hypothetical protein